MLKSLLIAAFVAAAGMAAADTLTIDGTDAVYGAGLPGAGSSTAATEFDFTPAAGLFVTASYVSGQTGCCGSSSTPVAGADGAAFLGSGNTTIFAANGISGFNAPSQMVLVGVFVDSSNLPMAGGVAPSTLNFAGNTNFASLNPLLNQTFWIGDGLTGTATGTTQQFFAPTGADRLLLGFADGGSFFGNPSFYGDNPGALVMNIEASVAPVPLPAGLPLLMAGLGMFAGLRRYQR